jgi:iron only hydrogenase large subunit-like protein
LANTVTENLVIGGVIMPVQKYIDIFGDFVKAYNQKKLKEKYDEYRESPDFEHISKYIFASLGLDYIKDASYEDVLRAMDMRQMKGKVVVKVEDCGLRCVDENGETECMKACPFGAVEIDEERATTIINGECTDCGACVGACEKGHIVDKIEFFPVAQYLDGNHKVYAIIAPAYIGQFGADVTPGQLRHALRLMGFTDLVEVAIFADILTLKEALEFDQHVHVKEDFMITSCCCPMWVGMLKRVYEDLVKHVSPSVSPMVACGRSIKAVHEDAKVVFIGPCVAKKAEAKEKDVSDSVDFVLTFEELQKAIDAYGINLKELCEDEGDQAARAGRIYAFTGGVSKAVEDTVNKLVPYRDIKVKAVQAHGVPSCKELLQNLRDGKLEANFVEGMGCVGGCVGGPKSILPRDEGREHVHHYGNETDMITPLDSPWVYGVLKSIGINDINELLDHEKAKIYERKF